MEYKVGYRQDIRSHVQKRAAKEFKQKQKTAWGIEEMGSSRQWQPLLPQGPGGCLRGLPRLVRDPDFEPFFLQFTPPTNS